MIKYIVDKKSLPYTGEINSFFQYISIAKINVLLIKWKTNESRIIYANPFDSKSLKYTINTPNGQEIEASIYFLLSKDNFLQLDNINYSKMFLEFKKAKYCQEYGYNVNNLVSEMILAYDEDNNKIDINDILKIAKWLYNKDSNYKFNYDECIQRSKSHA